MAKKSGGKYAEKIAKQENVRVADIYLASKSLAQPRSYADGGYPATKHTLHINKFVSKKARIAGSD